MSNEDWKKAEELTYSILDSIDLVPYIKKHNKEDIYGLIDELENAFELGANWQKEQMLNDGIECTIDDDIDMLFADYTNFDEDGYIREQGLKPGDKVKVIMIKVEE